MEGAVNSKISRADRKRIRAQFPALAGETVFLENAGGSQVPLCVADRIHDYMLSSYVQLGAGYPLSQRATEVVDEAHDFVRLMVNGNDGEVMLGPSTSQLLLMLSQCYARTLTPNSSIIVAQTGHEANVGPWKHLASQGFELQWWEMDPNNFECSLADLEELLNDRTALVAFPHVSNLLGEIVDVAEITKLAHAAGARVVVDGVAYAPHRAMDVTAWDVDWYVYSTYKVYGPHMAVLYGKTDALAELSGNARLTRVLSDLLESMQRFFFLGLDLGDFALEMRQEHLDLTRAIRERDRTAAVACALLQIERSRERIMTALIHQRADLPVN